MEKNANKTKIVINFTNSYKKHKLKSKKNQIPIRPKVLLLNIFFNIFKIY